MFAWLGQGSPEFELENELFRLPLLATPRIVLRACEARALNVRDFFNPAPLLSVTSIMPSFRLTFTTSMISSPSALPRVTSPGPFFFGMMTVSEDSLDKARWNAGERLSVC